ncbi:MAG: sorbosone dehydrogenase family protein [Bacteroidota bacterium]|nr:sorbosone dehydrogenase family protein [Bacteroidota bacterium]
MIILINLINSLSIIFLNIFINSIFVNQSSNLEIDSFLEKIVLPEGFEINIYADDVENARSMAISPSGTIFVGNRNKDNVFALKDTDGDNVIDKKYLITNKLKNMPNGVAFHDGDLYVAEVNKIWKFENIEENLSHLDKFDEYLEEPILISDDFPSDRHHGWKYISFGPDGKLYVPVGAPCNICESRDEIYASITRMNPDGSNREIYVKGVRNTVGFTWHPETKQLWFTDNGRDMLGDNIPPCELNKVTGKDQHFGYPYCHGDDIGDPEFGGEYSCSDFVMPVQNLGPHVAPLGLKFYTGKMFPDEYKGDIFIAEHGSWNRSKKIGYRISRVKIENNKSVGYETFIYGWLDDDEQEAWGRPVDILILEDGSMLISDDKANAIYRVTYTG